VSETVMFKDSLDTIGSALLHNGFTNKLSKYIEIRQSYTMT